MGFWTIPREWERETVAVLASGPSMTRAQADQVRAAGIPAIVVNSTFQLAPWADILYAADAAWWQHTPGAKQFEGIKVACEEVRGVHQIDRAGKVGYDDRQDAVHTFGNSGAQAIQIAAKAGAARILLLGFDMQGGHWHGRHPTPLRETMQDIYPIWRDHMGVLAASLKSRGVQVLNCTPGSALKCFPLVTLEDALAGVVHAL